MAEGGLGGKEAADDGVENLMGKKLKKNYRILRNCLLRLFLTAREE